MTLSPAPCSRPPCLLLAATLGILPFQALPDAKASLIINEVFQANQNNREWVEFLVTADITLGDLDSYWFGGTDSATGAIQNSARFDSAAILSQGSHFTSTSDIIKAGTLIVVGNPIVATDFTYNPDFFDPSNDASWNLTFTNGSGITGGTPFGLAGGAGAVWLSSAQPVHGTDVTNFVSAVAYLNGGDPDSGGAVADYIASQANGNGAYDVVHGDGGGFDGNLNNNRSLSNLGGSSIDFANSEGTPTLGRANGGANLAYIHSLRAVPEPATLVPLALLAAGGYLAKRRRARATA